MEVPNGEPIDAELTDDSEMPAKSDNEVSTLPRSKGLFSDEVREFVRNVRSRTVDHLPDDD